MEAQNFRELLEKSEDRLKIFEDINIIQKYKPNLGELISSIMEFLDDREKVKIFELEHFKNLQPNIKICIMNCISNDREKMNLLKNPDFILEIDKNEIVNIVKSLNDLYKIKLLKKPEFIKELNIQNFHIKEIIKSLSNENKQNILLNVGLIKNELELEKYMILEIINDFEENDKFNIFELYQLDDLQKTETLLDESKNEEVLDKKDKRIINKWIKKKIINIIGFFKRLFNKGKIKMLNAPMEEKKDY